MSTHGLYWDWSLDLTPKQRLSGEFDCGIIALAGTTERLYAAWTKTWEGPARPDRGAAIADLRERFPRVVP